MKIMNILITDDHPVTREGIKKILVLNESWTPRIDEATNGEDAVELARISDYDIIIMDIQMPEMDGIEATKKIMDIKPHSKILALSMFDDEYYILEMIKAGALGYILKNTGAEEMIKAVETIVGGKKYFSNDVSLKMLEPYFKQMQVNEPQPLPSILKLSSREKEILKMVVNGATNTEISTALNISIRTVENHRYRIAEKLNAKNAAELIRIAVKNKLV